MPLPSQESMILAAAKFRLQKRGEAVPPWSPNPGAQRLLVQLIENTKVEEIWYMGEAGGGKTHSATGLASTHFRNSIFFRREFNDLAGAEGPIEKSRALFNAFGAYNSQSKLWTLRSCGERRHLEFAGCEKEKDKQAQQGRPHDLYVFDEITHFLRSQPEYIVGWKRSPHPGQRTLELYLGNPPTTAEGEWVTEKVRPWVDKGYKRPAKAGEIRYFVSIDSQNEIEVDGPEPVEIKGVMRSPKSRTYVPSVLAENPTYAEGEYAKTLDRMPEPLRSILKYGDFMASKTDERWQVIPSAWVREAQARWRHDGNRELGLTALGVDPAQGGKDRESVAREYVNWITIESRDGALTPRGSDTAAWIMEGHYMPGVPIYVDAIGVGADAAGALESIEGCLVERVSVAEGTDEPLGALKFANKRSYAVWALRAALHPETGDNIALPPDSVSPTLMGDLTAFRYFLRSGRIAVSPKEELRKRLGRSTNDGDAVLLLYTEPRRPLSLEEDFRFGISEYGHVEGY